VRSSPTVHLGGSRAQVAAAENAVARGQHAEKPYVLVVQPTIFDPTRAPAGKHTLWAYIHVPRNSTVDPTEVVTAEIERFAPGFRDTILASASRNAVEVAAANPNDIGGEMSGGAVSVGQLIKRPVVSTAPWRTPGAASTCVRHPPRPVPPCTG